MKRVYFGTMENLAAFMVSAAADGDSSAAALFYDDANALMRELLLYDEIDLFCADLQPAEWDGYDKEYFVGLTADNELFVERAFGDNGEYLSFEDDCLILGAGASSSIIGKNTANHFFVYEAVFADDEDFDCDECDLCACECHGCESDDDDKIRLSITTEDAYYECETTLEKILSAFFD